MEKQVLRLRLARRQTSLRMTSSRIADTYGFESGRGDERFGGLLRLSAAGTGTL